LTKIKKDLEDYLAAHRIPAVAQIVGKASQSYIPSLLLGSFMRERDTLHGTMSARIDPDLCNGAASAPRSAPRTPLR